MFVAYLQCSLSFLNLCFVFDRNDFVGNCILDCNSAQGSPSSNKIKHNVLEVLRLVFNVIYCSCCIKPHLKTSRFVCCYFSIWLRCKLFFGNSNTQFDDLMSVSCKNINK